MSAARFDVVYDRVTSSRDLGSPDIWERSLARSLQRRRLTELGRRARRRRKSASLAVSAALAAVPVLPRGVAAADSGSGASAAGSTNTYADALSQASSGRVVLEIGSEGQLVSAAQQRLNEVLPLTHLAVDGIYGPLTQGAVTEFQRAHGLMPTGTINVGTWAVMFKAPVLIMSGPGAASGTATSGGSSSATSFVSDVRAGGNASGTGTQPASASATPSGAGSSAGAGGSGAATSSSAGGSGTAPSGTGAASGAGSSASAGSGSATTPPASTGNQPVAVVSPSAPTTQPSTYVLTNGVALPLPRSYIVNGYVDQGVDYSAPGGTPLYAMGSGVIIGEGISGFGPNAPILKITSGPLAGLEVYYGHSGTDLVKVGQHVTAGQQISEVGYGIVGISTGPHLEVGFYPPGPNGAGSRMLSLINSLLSQHSSGRAWGTGATAHVAGTVTYRTMVPSSAPASSAPAPPVQPSGETSPNLTSAAPSTPVSDQAAAPSSADNRQVPAGGTVSNAANVPSNTNAANVPSNTNTAEAAQANSQSRSTVTAAPAIVPPNSGPVANADSQSTAPDAAAAGGNSAAGPAQPQMQVDLHAAPQPTAASPQSSQAPVQSTAQAPQVAAPAAQANAAGNVASAAQANAAAAAAPAASATPAVNAAPAASATPAPSTVPAANTAAPAGGAPADTAAPPAGG